MIMMIYQRCGFAQKLWQHKTESTHATMHYFIGTKTEMQELTFVRFVMSF